MIYCVALAILYKDRFDKKIFCGLNPFEPICKSPVSEIQSYDRISQGSSLFLKNYFLRNTSRFQSQKSSLMKFSERDDCQIVAENQGLTTQVQITPKSGKSCLTFMEGKVYIS